VQIGQPNHASANYWLNLPATQREQLKWVNAAGGIGYTLFFK
jgi:hypothetical protein